MRVVLTDGRALEARVATLGADPVMDPELDPDPEPDPTAPTHKGNQ